MWESCANKQLHCPINVIFQSDVPVPKLLWLRQLSIPAPPRAGAGGAVADAGRHVSDRAGGSGDGAGRQLNFYTTGRVGERCLRFAFCRSHETRTAAVATRHAACRAAASRRYAQAVLAEVDDVQGKVAGFGDVEAGAGLPATGTMASPWGTPASITKKLVSGSL